MSCYCHVIHINERVHIQGCQFEVNADDENISPVDNSEISIDAENPWENFILNFPEDVSSFLWPLRKLLITLNDGKASDHLNIKGCRFGIFGMDIGYENSEEISRTVSCSWLAYKSKGLTFSSKNCFIYWSPNDSTPREKMMTMSTKSKFKEKLGCEIEIQIFDNSDLEIENIGRVTHANCFYAFHW